MDKNNNNISDDSNNRLCFQFKRLIENFEHILKFIEFIDADSDSDNILENIAQLKYKVDSDRKNEKSQTSLEIESIEIDNQADEIIQKLCSYEEEYKNEFKQKLKASMNNMKKELANYKQIYSTQSNPQSAKSKKRQRILLKSSPSLEIEWIFSTKKK